MNGNELGFINLEPVWQAYLDLIRRLIVIEENTGARPARTGTDEIVSRPIMPETRRTPIKAPVPKGNERKLTKEPPGSRLVRLQRPVGVRGEFDEAVDRVLVRGERTTESTLWDRNLLRDGSTNQGGMQ